MYKTCNNKCSCITCCNCKCICSKLENKISYICKNQYDFFLNKSNVQAVGLGYKEIQGILTNEKCIKVFVSQKISSNNLPSADLIPPIYNGIKTDVVKSGIFTSCGLTEKIRPVPNGYSIGPAGYKMAGTLGCIVQNPSERAYYILGTNHVLAQLGKAKISTPILQPGVLDGGSVNTDIIANLTKYIPIKFKTFFKTPENYIDAAIAEISNISLVSPKVAIINNKFKDIGIPEIGQEVFKVGRTTGYTTGRITSIDATAIIKYPDGTALFKDQILASTEVKVGDSGSILATKNLNPLGMLSSASENFAAYNDMIHITSQLQIQIVK
ncbi:serine protease [Clostridium botulinum C]|uniref:S1 family peptidase n=1 Tax=Clostridium botulinum TaxID=1491 RepID=UPI001E3B2F8F|nr:S1 family peptidase [Clostridium botulinum]MCD3217656.1 serine protease [Clostridium botulinum C]